MTVKYVIVLMRADNRGEGGILALTVLALRAAGAARRRWVLVAAGLIGAALFFGDGVLTPAISVLSAVEGLEGRDARASSPTCCRSPWCCWSCCSCCSATAPGGVGGLFGPIMHRVVRDARRCSGSSEIVRNPAMLLALNPLYAIELFIARPGDGLRAARRGRAGGDRRRGALRRHGAFRPRGRSAAAWLRFVFPALLLNYFGQGALLLADPDGDREPVLPAGAGMGAASAGRARLDGDDHRLAGGDLRRLLADPAGGAARLSAAHAGPPHLGAGDRPGLRAARQLDAARRGGRDRCSASASPTPRRGLRHRRDRHDDDRHDPRLHLHARRAGWPLWQLLPLFGVFLRRSICRSSPPTC